MVFLRHHVVAAVLAACFLLLHPSGVLQAKTKRSVFWLCDNARNPDVRIRACTRILKNERYRRRTRLNVVHHHLGIAWWDKGNLRRALAEFKAALRYNPKDADTRQHLRDVQRELRQRRQQRKAAAAAGRSDAARAASRSASPASPKAERLMQQARKLLDDNREAPAREKLRQALKLLNAKAEKSSLSTHERLLKAEALVLLNKPDEALEIWRDLRGKLLPDARVRDMLIELWHRLNNMGEHAAKLEVGRLTVEASPSKADYHALFHLLLGTESMGEMQEMAQAARRIIALWEGGAKPYNDDDAAFFATRAYLALGNVFLNEGKLDEAERSYRQSATLEPKYHVPWNNMGWIALLRGKNEQAIEYFEKALRLSPRYGSALSNLHIAWNNLGLHRRAIRALTRLISLHPAASYFQMRAWQYYLVGELDAAEQDVKRALAKERDLADALAVLGLLQARREQYGEALKNIERAVRKGADWPLLHLEHGRLLERLGRPDEARKAYERAITAERPETGEEPENARARQQARQRLAALAKPAGTRMESGEEEKKPAASGTQSAQ